MTTNSVSAEALSLTRRVFTGRLIGAVAAIASGPAIALAAEPAVAEATAIGSVPLPVERLQSLISELRTLLNDEFPGFEFVHSGLPFGPDGDPNSTCFLFGAVRPYPKPMPIIEYDGPGVYIIRLKRWGDDFRQLRYVEVTPKGHRFAGQFRLRPAVEGSRARWWYVPKDEFLAIKRL